MFKQYATLLVLRRYPMEMPISVFKDFQLDYLLDLF